MAQEPPKPPAKLNPNWFGKGQRHALGVQQTLGAELYRKVRADIKSSVVPLFVVHTVHGTWAKRSCWPEKDSPLSTAIRNALGPRTHIEPFRWSGKNRIHARAEAADAFRAHLGKKFAEFPDAQHFVVGHSHGGSVALMAADRPEIAARLTAVVALSTPFLSAQVREQQDLIDGPIAFFAALSGAVGCICWRLYNHDAFATSLPWAALVFVVVWLALVFGGWAVAAMHRAAEGFARRMPRTSLRSEQVAIIRVQGDEPIAVMAGVRLAGTMSDLMHQMLDSRLVPTVRSLLDGWSYERVADWMKRGMEQIVQTTPSSSRPWTISAPVSMEKPVWVKRGVKQTAPTTPISSRPWAIVAPVATWEPVNPTWDTVKPFVQTYWPACITFIVNQIAQAHPLLHYLLLVLAVLYALPALLAVIVVAIGVPFGFISGVSLITTGIATPLAGPYLDVAAEASPPGSWTVTNLECGRVNRGLIHSELHANDSLEKAVVDSISARLATRA